MDESQQVSHLIGDIYDAALDRSGRRQVRGCGCVGSNFKKDVRVVIVGGGGKCGGIGGHAFFRFAHAS
jgi:hypothetical protein